MTTKNNSDVNSAARTTKPARPPKNMTELRDELLNLFAQIGTGGVDLTVAKETSNAAGKIIKTASVQLEYAIARKAKPNIPFLK
jgi:hypothetical protein